MMIDTETRELVHEKGRVFIGSKMPEWIKRFPTGQCYDASIWNIISGCAGKKLYYCEGIAFVPSKGVEVLHGWITDEDMQIAYDPTWKIELEGEEISNAGIIIYKGIVMDPRPVAEFMLHTERAGVIANRKLREDLSSAAIESIKCN